MARRTSHITLSCPVQDEEGSPCGEPILVHAWPGSPGTRWDPPEGPEIEVVKADKCGHMGELEDLSDKHFESLMDQLAELEGADREDDRAYDDAQDAAIDRERERWADLP